MTTPTGTKTPPATGDVKNDKKTRKPPRDLSKHVAELNLDASLVEPGADWVRPARTVTRTARPRSDQQKKLDAQAADLYKRWAAIPGKPRDMDKSPKAQYTVDPAHVDALVALLRKTADVGGGVPGKSVKIRQATHPSGKIAVTVAVWDKPPSETAKKK